MSSERVTIKIPPAIAQAIMAHPNYQEPRPGIRSGIGGWLMANAAQSLGLEAVDPHARQSAKWREYAAQKESS